MQLLTVKAAFGGAGSFTHQKKTRRYCNAACFSASKNSPDGKEDFRSDHEGNGSKCQVRRMANMTDITAWVEMFKWRQREHTARMGQSK